MDRITANNSNDGIRARTLHLMLTNADRAGVLDNTILRVEIDGKMHPVSALVRGAGIVALRVDMARKRREDV